MKEAAEEEAMMAGVLAQSRLEAEQARERRDGRRRGGSVGGERQGGGIFLRSRRSRSENPSPQDSSPTSLRSEGYTATSPAGGSPSHLVPPQTVTSPQPQQRGRSFTSVSAIFRRRSSNHSRSSAVQSARNATAPPTSPSAPSLSTLAAPPSIAVVPSTPVPPSPETPSTTSTNNLTLDPTLEVQSTRARLTAMKTRLEQARNRIISPSSTTTTSASDTSSLRLTATALLAIDAALLDVGDAIGMGVLAELEAHVREVEDAVSRASSVQDEGGDERGGVVSLSGSLDDVTEEEGELDEVTVESGNHEKR
ncbi:hypothetical protein BC829DRAFT_395611 [Chytridium lagenaria]|nr:hypothetical protein BC829DRAFT_395611 [Chytridium lagenaria]